MGSIVAEIADKIASAGGGERSELEVRGGTGADGGGILTLSTSELTVVDGDKLGRIDFQAPLDEAEGDAILVPASIWAEADATFSSTVNNTELVFATATGTAAAEKMRLDSAGQLGIGVTTPASLLHVAGTVQVGVDDTGHDVKFFGATSGSYWLWDESADKTIQVGASQITGALTVGVDDTGHDVKFFGATSGAYMLWDESTDDLILGGAAQLGIGTTAPAGTLHVQQSAVTSAATPNGDRNGLVIEKGGGHAGISIITDADKQGQIVFSDTAEYRGSIKYDHATDKMEFTTAGVSHMNLYAEGELQITSDGYGYGLTCTGGGNGSPHFHTRDAGALQLGMDSGGGGGMYFRMYSGGYGDRLHISAAGTFTGSGTNNISDQRLKENIATISSGLTKINALTGRTFSWKSIANLPEQSGTQYGFIAQEVETVVPEAVWQGSGIRKFNKATNAIIDETENETASEFDSETEEWAKSVNTLHIVPILVEAIKELSAKVTALENA